MAISFQLYLHHHYLIQLKQALIFSMSICTTGQQILQLVFKLLIYSLGAPQVYK